jgi:hypothetical protein
MSDTSGATPLPILAVLGPSDASTSRAPEGGDRCLARGVSPGISGIPMIQAPEGRTDVMCVEAP